MFLEPQLYLLQALEMAQAAREELPPVPHSLLPPGSMTAAIAQIQMETESVIITRTDPASTWIQTGTGSVIIIRRSFPQVWFLADIMEPVITGDGETVIIKEGWKKRCEVRKKPEGPLICTGTQ